MRSFFTFFAFYLIFPLMSAYGESTMIETPVFDIRQDLSGTIDAWGVVNGRDGKVNLHFTAVLIGRWDGNKGVLDETFTYNDGRIQKRTWHINVLDDNNFTATAADVVGTAKGTQQGNTVHMQYVLTIPWKDGTIDLSMDDWLYKTDDKTIVNHATMKKFGFKVGELVVAFKKR